MEISHSTNLLRKAIIIFIVLAIIPSCTSSVGPFDWLEGEWVSKFDGQQFSEHWERNGAQYIAIAFEMKKGDTTFIENLRIFKNNGVWTYGARIENQNEGREIYFPLVLDSAGHYLFSNPDHDFPTQIRYVRLAEDSITVTAQGMVNEQLDGFTLGFKRMNP